jgi:hypothetical protein
MWDRYQLYGCYNVLAHFAISRLALVCNRA